MIKKYKIDYLMERGVVEVEIDHSILTEEKIKEINDFWDGADFREATESSLLNAVLKMLGNLVLILQVEYDYNAEGIIDLFDYNDGKGQEGWPKMDGSMGIKLIYAEISFDVDDMEIKEITEET